MGFYLLDRFDVGFDVHAVTDHHPSGLQHLIPREPKVLAMRALALARSDRIGVDDLPPELDAAPPTVQTADEIRTLAEVERDYIAAALRASGGNRAKAAEKLGIGAATLYRKLKQARP